MRNAQRSFEDTMAHDGQKVGTLEGVRGLQKKVGKEEPQDCD